MMKCRPGKWLLWSPLLVGLPLLCAGYLYSGIVQQSVRDHAQAALDKSGNGGWAKLQADGRDISITGDAPNQEAINAAVAAVANAYGVRAIAKNSIALMPPPPKVEAPFFAPTITSAATNQNPAKITGTWPEAPDRSLAVTFGDKTYKSNADKELTSDGKGNWTLLAGNLKDGAYDIAVEAADAGGKVAKLASPAKFLFDTVAPAAAAFLPVAAALAPKAISGQWPEAEAKDLTVTVTGKDGAASYVKGKDPALASNGKGAWTLTFPKALGPGSYDLSTKVTDLAGNVTESPAIKGAIIVDPEPPAPPVFESMTVKGGDASHLTGKWAEGDASALTVEIDKTPYDFGTFRGLTSKAGQWDLALPAPLADGVHAVDVVTKDAAGNRSVVSGTVTVDSIVPTAPSFAALPAIVTAPLTKLTGNWSPAEATALAVDLDGGAHQLGTSKALTSDIIAGTWTLDLGKPIAEGSHKLTVTTTDAAGNSSSASSSFVVDTLRPAVPVIMDQLSREPVSQITGSWAENGADKLYVDVDGSSYGLGSFKGLHSTGEPGSFALDLPRPLSEGEHKVTVYVANSSGNSSKASATITVDTTPPTTPVFEGLASQAPVSRLTGAWTKAETKSLSVAVDGAVYNYGRLGGPEDGGAAGSWTLALPQALGDGAHEVTVTASDLAGNQSIATGMIVVDATPPMAPIVNSTLANAPVAQISGAWNEADVDTLVVMVDGSRYSSQDDQGPHASGTQNNWVLDLPAALGEGNHTVKVTATDKLGNVSEGAGQIVVDTTPPGAPSFKGTITNEAPKTLSGSWGSGEPAALSVHVDDATYMFPGFAGLKRAETKGRLGAGTASAFERRQPRNQGHHRRPGRQYG